MTQLRPELGGDGSKLYAPTGATAYMMILNAVRTKDGLVHGKLHAHGESCAIGSYFDVNRKATLYTFMIDEVAAVNDSAPHLSERGRKAMVIRWLRWKLAQLGMAV